MRFKPGLLHGWCMRPVSVTAWLQALLTIFLSCLLGYWLPSSLAPVSSIPQLFKVLLGL